jgi:hypothetical protein
MTKIFFKNSQAAQACLRVLGNASQECLTGHVVPVIRRFLLHCLPDGFHRIRHYGFLANGVRRARLALIRQLLAEMP